MTFRTEHLAEGVTLYCGDCREILPDMPNDMAVVSDPPYGIAFSKGESGKRVTGRRLTSSRFTDPIHGDGQPFDPSSLMRFAEVIVWGSDHFFARLPDRGRWLAWDKKSGWDFVDSFSDVEFAWHSEDGAARIINYLWKGVRQAGEKGLPKFHIMQKPIAVMDWCIGQLKNKTVPILDPFMGSGTTGVSAVKAGRGFVGVEIDPAYFDTARRRISDALARPDLFVEPPPPPAKQEALAL